VAIRRKYSLDAQINFAAIPWAAVATLLAAGMACLALGRFGNSRQADGVDKANGFH
jgi:hypothetical protein